MAVLISSSIIACLKSFNEFMEDIRNLPHCKNVRGLDLSAWEDELGRLRVWAANIDAQQSGQSSLEFRLRDASHVREQILKLLQGLLRRLQDARDVLADDGESDSQDAAEYDTDENALAQEDQKTEIQELQESLRANVNCLFQMSILVRKPAQHDLYLGSKRGDVAVHEPFDYDHVKQKFPEADDMLVRRLRLDDDSTSNAEHDRLAASPDYLGSLKSLPAVPVADSAAIESMDSTSGSYTYREEKRKHSEIMERVGLLGPEHTDTLRSMTELAKLFSDKEIDGEASHWERQVMETKKRRLGEEHPETLESMMNVARYSKGPKQSVDAEMMYQQALNGYEKTFGPNHTITLSAVKELGGLYIKQNKHPEAEAKYLRALNGYVQTLGPNHTITLNMCNVLGDFYKKLDLAPAERWYKRALDGYIESLGSDHELTISTINNLGKLHEQQHELVEAEERYLQVLNGYVKTLGPDHTMTLDMCNNLGGLYEKQINFTEAEAMYERALNGYTKSLGPDHELTLSTIEKFGRLYVQQNKLAQAEAMYKRALTGYRKTLGPDDPKTVATAWKLRSLY